LQKRWELSLLRFSQQSDRVAASTIHLQLQWRRARCALRAASWAGKSLGESWEEFSAPAAGAEDSVPVILSEAKNLWLHVHRDR
jgi:hypothetical protein